MTQEEFFKAENNRAIARDKAAIVYQNKMAKLAELQQERKRNG